MRRAVTAFVDSELDATTTGAVAIHVRECWACSGDVELARLVKYSLRNRAARERDALAAVRLRRFAAGLTN